jgi:xanthine phosphoribosyltransferase
MTNVVQELKARIQNEGQNLGNGILKIDSILNHQLDSTLMMNCGQEFADRFADAGVTRVLTAEVSGIAPALATGFALNVPIVYARKTKPVTMFGPVFLETAPSHTKGGEVNLLVSAEFLPPNERVLIIDDFLASGKTLKSLVRIVQSARCTLVGIACVVEKTFEGGREELSKYGVPIESIAKIVSMDDNQITLGD